MFIGQRPRSMSFQVHVHCKCHFRCIGVEFVQTWKWVGPGPLEYTTDDTVEEALGTEHQDAAQHKDVCKHMISFTLLGDHLNYSTWMEYRTGTNKKEINSMQSRVSTIISLTSNMPLWSCVAKWYTAMSLKGIHGHLWISLVRLRFAE